MQIRGWLCYSVVAALLLVLSSCATNRGGFKSEDEIVNRLVGMSITELVQKLGAPTETIDMGDAGRSMSYRGTTEGLTGGQCSISVVVQGGIVTSANAFANDRSWISFPMGSCASIIQNLD